MSDRLLIGLDLGTTKVKGSVFDLSGARLASAEREHALHRPRAGWAEQDAEGWWAATSAILRELSGAAGPERVAAVGIVSQVNTHVPVDRDLVPLGPAITWQDQRCAGVAAELDARLGEPLRSAVWGEAFRVDASYLPARLAWLERERPAVREATRWMLLPKDFVNARLTGEVATDPLSAIGLTTARGGYIEELDTLVPGVSGVLPPLEPVTGRLGVVRAPETGLSPSTAVAVATMDAWGSLYGSGLTRAGQGMAVAGTSEIIGILGAGGSGAPGIVTFHPYEGLQLHAGPTQAGGDALRWFAALQHLDVARVLDEAAGAPPGSGGVVFLPHLMGERAPLWNSQARGVFFGLSLDHDRTHLCRALLEGVAYSARHLFESACAAAAVRPEALRLSGGGSASDLWSQIKADALGVPLQRLRVRDTGVLGAALVAGVAAGALEDVSEGASRLVAVEREFVPDERDSARLAGLYAVYRELQDAVTPAFTSLAAQAGRPPS